MATEPIFPGYAAPLPKTGASSTAVLGNRDRIVAPQSVDPCAARLAAQISGPSKPPTNISTTDSEELLHEMGHKTFQYKNPAIPDKAVNWKNQTNQELNIVIQKATMFSVISLMDSNIDAVKTFEIVKETHRSHRSLVDVYMEKVGQNRSFPQRLLARWRHFFYFQCNIVPNIINKFMQTFLEKLRSELIQKDGGKNIPLLVDKVLTEASSFLDLYQKATENYQKGIDLQGSRDVHIAYELAKKQSIKDVCCKFAMTAVREFLPRVPFFERWHNSSFVLLRIIGTSLDRTLGWLFNRMLRKLLQISIPSVFESIVESSIDATKPSNLPFVVSITEGILDQLRKFRAKIEQSKDSPHEPPHSVPGSEKLPEVVKKLIDVLKLEPCDTRKELQQPSKAKSASIPFLSGEIDKNILDSCIDGCRVFINYFTRQENSEEIFYLMLNLANATFESNTPTTQQEWDDLLIKYESLKQQMRDESRKVFQTVIHSAVNERLQGPPESHIKELIMKFEAEQHSRSLETAEKLLKNDQSIQAKLVAYQQKETSSFCDPLDIVEELDKMNEAIDRYQSLNVLNDTKKFPSSIQQGIAMAMQPIFSNMNALLDQITYAKKLHKTIQKNNLFSQELNHLHSLLCSKPADFKILDYKKSLDQLHSISSHKEVEHAGFDTWLKELDTTCSDIETDSLTMRTLLALDQTNGLLPKLFHATRARINGQSVPIRLNDLHEIAEIHNLEATERKELHACILAFAASKDHAEMSFQWGKLKEKMTYLFNKHRYRQNKLLNQNKVLVQQYLQAIDIKTNSLHKDLTECTHIMSTIIQNTADYANEIKIQKVESFPTRVISKLGGLPPTIGALSGAALAASALILPRLFDYNWLVFTAGIATTTLLWGTASVANAALAWYGGDKGKKLSAINTLAGAAIGGAVIAQINPAIPLVAAGIGGYLEARKLKKDIPDHICDEEILPQVNSVFDPFCKFILKPHVWKWMIIDSLKCVNDAYS
jgi:hypothetical protein